MEQLKLTVIRGNISEIKTLALGSGTTKGVDADVADAVTEGNTGSGGSVCEAVCSKIRLYCGYYRCH